MASAIAVSTAGAQPNWDNSRLTASKSGNNFFTRTSPSALCANIENNSTPTASCQPLERRIVWTPKTPGKTGKEEMKFCFAS
jgi:hypothetical protein